MWLALMLCGLVCEGAVSCSDTTSFPTRSNDFVEMRKGMGKPFTNYSIDVRECLVRVGNELVQENRSQQDVLDLFCRSGYTVDDSTFSRLLAKVQNNEPLYAETKHSGAVKKLSLLQERIVIGFAYQNYLDGTPQEWLSLSTFAQNELQCNISPSRLIQRLHPRGVGTYLGKFVLVHQHCLGMRWQRDLLIGASIVIVLGFLIVQNMS